MTQRLWLAVLTAWMLATGIRPVPAHSDSADVLACDTLVNLRVLMGHGDRSVAQAMLSRHPGCRAVPRDRMGAAEHRAMVGGAPFECLSVSGEEACLWVWP